MTTVKCKPPTKTHPRSRASLGGSIPAILVLYSFMCVIVECDGPSLMFAVAIWHVVGFGGTRHPDLRNPPKRLWRRPEFVLEGFPDPQARDPGNLQTRRWGLLEFVLEGSRVPRPGPRKTFQNGLGCALVWESFPGPPARGPGKTIQNKIGGASTSFWRVGTLETLQNDVGGAPNSFWRVSRLRPARDSGNPRKRFWDAPIVLKGCPGPGPGDPGNSPKRLRGRSDIVLERFPDPPAQHPGNRPKRRRGRPAVVLEEFTGSPGPGPENLSKATSAPNSF